jgi:hypothetical protein
VSSLINLVTSYDREGYLCAVRARRATFGG